MNDELATMVPEQQRAYVAEIADQKRRLTWATRMRVVTIHVTWLIVLIAGAGVSLVEVLDLADWLPAVLGFVVVVFQGIDRIFGRTSAGSRAEDTLRRGLAREERLLLAGAGPYETPEDRGTQFATRCERLLSKYDTTMTEYYAGLTSDTAATMFPISADPTEPKGE